MPHSFWLLLAAKMLTTAIIVVAASKIVERAGPFIGAMVATLPISAGPSATARSTRASTCRTCRSATSSASPDAAQCSAA